MKPILDYGLHDWLRLRPLLHAIKTARYRHTDRVYRHRPPRHGDLRSICPLLRGRKVLVAIAYEDVQVIDWQTRLLRLFVPNALYIIADNSVTDQGSSAIARLAHNHDVPYVRLPVNPSSKGSRSHGLALNWVWYNLIRPGRPEAAGFLDHDLFPTAPDDPFAALATQDFFGLVRTAGPRWFLWAGFCMFRFDQVEHKPLDFRQDWFNGLDTGGGNWHALYRHVDRSSLLEVTMTPTTYKPGIEYTDGPLQWCGTWLHEVGMMGRSEWQGEKRQAVARMLEPYLGNSAS
jgi:hypothetical protein